MPLLRLEDTVQAQVDNYQSSGQMKYHLSLCIDNLAVFGLLSPEMERFDNARSSIRLSKKGKKTFVDIDAEDAVALRASTDSVVQLLRVFEKVSEIK
jgi:tRNA threonylcarbamoyladenosine modification (KEOPS) complex  Pcc1 subunit